VIILPDITVNDLGESGVTTICCNVECLSFHRCRVESEPFQVFLLEHCIGCRLLRD